MNSITDDRLVLAADKALCRSHIYSLLASGFGYPDESGYQGFSDGKFIDEIRQELGVCSPELLEHFNEVLAPGLKLACSREVFESQFLSAFETNMPSPSASLNEGVHIFKSDRPNLLLELKGFYSNFGLQVDSKGNELEDTLTAELDFMQFLAFAMEVHPYVSFTFYIFLWIIDTFITKKLMLSKVMIYWILKKY